MTGPFRLSKNEIDVAELKPVALFRDVDDHDLEKLAQCFVELTVPNQKLILQEGEISDAFYVIAEGSVSVFKDAVGWPVQLLARLQRGDFFGEFGLFGGGRHSASVRASEACRILRISKQHFFEFLDHHPNVLQGLQSAATRRYSVQVASALELGRRREVRIRCKHTVMIKTGSGEPEQVVLENLSLGGLSLSRAPESWQSGTEVIFHLALREGDLPLRGSVVWRHRDTIGLKFTHRSPNHDMMIQMATRLLLDWGARHVSD